MLRLVLVTLLLGACSPIPGSGRPTPVTFQDQVVELEALNLDARYLLCACIAADTSGCVSAADMGSSEEQCIRAAASQFEGDAAVEAAVSCQQSSFREFNQCMQTCGVDCINEHDARMNACGTAANDLRWETTSCVP